MPDTSYFLRLLNNRTKANLFLLRKLPAAYFSGVRINAASAAACTTSVPFRWFTKNPFRSTYFACLSMAAELSTGALAMAALYGRSKAVSMLLVQVEGRFFKKATGHTIFTCTAGLRLQQAVENAIETGTPQTVKVASTGTDAAGNRIAEFWFTWSFKAKG